MMTYLLIFALLAIVFAAFAAVGTEGCWHGLITLVNVIFAALIATNAYEPLALRLHFAFPAFGYLADFLLLWILFAFVVAVLQYATRSLSTVRVRLGGRLDQLLGFALALVTGWVLVCFTMMTLHTAPLPREAFNDALAPRLDDSFADRLAPDRIWLNSVQRLSYPAALGRGEGDEPSFDPAGEFILKYASRRDDNHRAEPGLFSRRSWGAKVVLGKDQQAP
ncbi:MAG: CvpA family protein [Planctomycetota bacterium]|nr:MAG: CvpA family protein [Planctomycetota bacterium]REJ92680.1 MAG: CvpA family protein [Planctomycetota bacterium]REK23717.1 MAG: CvpA family protein [Planctomycetota bacterium]REK47570.1 MAG: CvpA family protein [Planctomycetota bacterium]